MEASAFPAPAAAPRVSLAGPLLRLRSDEQLVALFRAGNDAAFDVIHDRYRQRLFAYARQMLGGSRQDAEDALQDVFLRAYAGLRANGKPVSLKAWLYRVAHNRCIDHLRRPRTTSTEGLEEPSSPLHDPMEVAERREDLRRLVRDVQRLPEQQRSVLLMREIDGLSYSELSAAAGVTVPAVKSLLVRARIGLVEAREARDADCPEIRADLCLSADRGVRASGRARRHLRECGGCRDFRSSLRASRRELAALLPAGAGPLTVLAQVLGIGGSGAGVGAGGTAAAGGGAIVGGGTAMTATKVAAVVASAAVVSAGGAAEVKQRLSRPASAPVPVVTVPSPARAAGVTQLRARPPGPLPEAVREPVAPPVPAEEEAPPAAPVVPGAEVAPTDTTDSPKVVDETEAQTGGTQAPAELDQVDSAPATTHSPGKPSPDPVAPSTTWQKPQGTAQSSPPASSSPASPAEPAPRR